MGVGLIELLIMMAIALGVLVPVVVVVVVLMNRRSNASVMPNFPDGIEVIVTPADGAPELVGTLVRTDNDYALVEVAGERRFVPRGTLRPAVDRALDPRSAPSGTRPGEWGPQPD